MRRAFTASPTSINLRGKPIFETEDRQRLIPGSDQVVFSRFHQVRAGARAELFRKIAPTLVQQSRIGRITLLDDDFVEASNLNRQRFYELDIGKNSRP